jgi:hypothetical protein
VSAGAQGEGQCPSRPYPPNRHFRCALHLTPIQTESLVRRGERGDHKTALSLPLRRGTSNPSPPPPTTASWLRRERGITAQLPPSLSSNGWKSQKLTDRTILRNQRSRPLTFGSVSISWNNLHALHKLKALLVHLGSLSPLCPRRPASTAALETVAVALAASCVRLPDLAVQCWHQQEICFALYLHNGIVGWKWW